MTPSDERGFQRHSVIRRTAMLEPGPNPDLMDRLADKCFGLQPHPLALRGSLDCLVIRVSVVRISGVGSWIEEAAFA